MKYEEIKIGDVFTYGYIDDEETVISKSDEYKIITTIDDDKIPTTWTEEELHHLKPLKEELPEEGLLVAKNGALVYRTGGTSGYGFEPDEDYNDTIYWTFISNSTYWKPATPEQEEKFVEMLKKECEKRGLFEDAKIEKHAQGYGVNLNSNFFELYVDATEIYNKNGQIFYKGNFATPRKEETTLELVSKATLDLSKFGVEIEQKGNVLIINPIKK